MPLRTLLVDNLDSFTFNLVHALAALGAQVEVVPAAQLSVDAVRARAPEAIVLGPGPGAPADAPILAELVRAFGPGTPMLGVCLGHQAIALAYGGEIVRTAPVHGRTSPIHHDGTGVFADVPPGAPMTRYHSLAVAALPDCLLVNAWTDDGVPMGLRHRAWPVHGVQFHPESVLSGAPGRAVLAGFLALALSAR